MGPSLDICSRHRASPVCTMLCANLQQVCRVYLQQASPHGKLLLAAWLLESAV